MLKTRVIACVLLRNGAVVQSKGFKRYQMLGDPATIVERLSAWACDELVYLDISRSPVCDAGRRDLGRCASGGINEIIAHVSTKAFMPLACGGGIRDVDDAVSRIAAGADKIVINTQAVQDPSFVGRLARALGSQCVVVSVDVRAEGDDWRVFADGGRAASDWTVVDFCNRIQDEGAGEILLHSIDRDGAACGYDLPLIQAVTSAVSLPVVALGGVGCWDHFADAIELTDVSGVAAANVFHYTENSIHEAKKYLHNKGLNVRRPELLNIERAGDGPPKSDRHLERQHAVL